MRLISFLPTPASFILACALGGCSHDPNFGLRSKAVLVIAVDNSVPGKDAREAQIEELESIVKSADESHYLIEIWAYGKNAERAWGPAQLSDVDQIHEAEVNHLAVVKPGMPRIARPALALAALAADKQFASMPYGRIVFITDGTVTGVDGYTALSNAAHGFASRAGWRVEAIGISAANEARWKQALEPSLGQRCSFTSQDVAHKVLKENHDE